MRPGPPSDARSRHRWVCSALASSEGPTSGHSAAVSRSIGTTVLARTSSAASSVRARAPPTPTGRSPSVTSRGPRMPNFTARHLPDPGPSLGGRPGQGRPEGGRRGVGAQDGASPAGAAPVPPGRRRPASCRVEHPFDGAVVPVAGQPPLAGEGPAVRRRRRTRRPGRGTSPARSPALSCRTWTRVIWPRSARWAVRMSRPVCPNRPPGAPTGSSSLLARVPYRVTYMVAPVPAAVPGP